MKIGNLNLELDFDPILVSNTGQKWARFSNLGKEKLNSRIYFEPSSSPKLSRQDSRIGSCFSEWTVPTPSQIFVTDKNSIVDCTELLQDMCLEEYKFEVTQHIVATLEKCYKEHNVVYLAYSGSIDSGVILSYILKMGFASRTHVRCFLNNATDHPSALKHDQVRIDRMNSFFKEFSKEFASVGWEHIDNNDIVKLINQGKNYHHLISYTMSAVLDRYKDSAWVGGFHGNRTLLHQRMFLDQMRIVDPSQTDKFKILIDSQWQNVYSPSIKKLNLQNDPIHTKFETHCQKPWHAISGWQNNKIYMPLASEHLFQSLRSLNPCELSFELIADATFGKELLMLNAPELVPWLDQQQSSHEQDNLENVLLHTHDIDFSQLQIPMNLNHDPEGLHWIVNELDQAKRIGVIEINSLVSVKNLQWIAQKTKL